MTSSSASDRDAQRAPGFAPGKRVWLKNTWDAAIVALRLGENASRMLVLTPPRQGYVGVTLADGTEDKIVEGLLRFTSPRGHTAKRETVKAKAPAKRKEAIDPALGTELTIEDALEDR